MNDTLLKKLHTELKRLAKEDATVSLGYNVGYGAVINPPIKTIFFDVRSIRASFAGNEYSTVIVGGTQFHKRFSWKYLADNIGLFPDTANIVVLNTHIDTQADLAIALRTNRTSKRVKGGGESFDVLVFNAPDAKVAESVE